jgi:hypothetical protein
MCQSFHLSITSSTCAAQPSRHKCTYKFRCVQVLQMLVRVRVQVRKCTTSTSQVLAHALQRRQGDIRGCRSPGRTESCVGGWRSSLSEASSGSRNGSPSPRIVSAAKSGKWEREGRGYSLPRAGISAYLLSTHITLSLCLSCIVCTSCWRIVSEKGIPFEGPRMGYDFRERA